MLTLINNIVLSLIVSQSHDLSKSKFEFIEKNGINVQSSFDKSLQT